MEHLTADDIRTSLFMLFPYEQSREEALGRELNVKAKSVKRWIKGDNTPPKFLGDHLAWRVAGKVFWQITSNLPYDNFPDSVNFAIYASENELKIITGEPWNYLFRAEIMKRLVVMLEIIGINCRLVTIDAPGYFEWLGDRKNTPNMRGLYAGEVARD